MSLSEQIAELSKPATEFDIEDNDLRNDVFDNENDNLLNTSESEDETTKKEHYVDVDKSNLRKKNDELNLGKKYNGNIKSRSDLYGSDDQENISEEEESSVNEDGDEQEQGGEESDEEDEESNEDQSESDEESDTGKINGEEDSNLSHKRSKLKEIMSNERTHIVNRLSNSATNDSVKGFAILQQHKVFDSIIDSRMKCQKSLTNSNVLPIDIKTMNADNHSSKKTKRYLHHATDKCYDLLDSIMALRLKLLKKDSIISSSESAKAFNPKKRSLVDYLDATLKQDSILDKYRSSVLTKWSSKIYNASGSTAISAGKFKSINQSAEQQVINNLSDMDRLVKRTKLNRRQVKPLGYDYYLEQHNDKPEQEASMSQDQDIPNEIPASLNGVALSELSNIFDDEDFYRVLLNDLVDKKIQSSDPASGLTISLRSVQQAQKFKKNIDTKASKGRKLRYHVQEQIANFEAPRGNWKWDDNQIDEFFASLLGQKVNMNEIDDGGDSDGEGSDEESNTLVEGNDSIKLFG